jgi:hypothetical protein
MNYPRLWISLVNIAGLKDLSACVLGVVLVAAFFLSTLLLIRVDSWADAIVWLIALLSPAVTLALERGNNDVVVFIIAIVGLWLLRRSAALQYLGALLLLFVSLLKLFPAIGMLPLVLSKRRASAIAAGACLLVYFLVVLFSADDIRAIVEVVPRSIGTAYGGEVSVALAIAVPKLTTVGQHLTPSTRLAGYLLSAGLVLSGFLLGNRIHRRIGGRGASKPLPLMFTYGTLIFVGTYFLGSNWDYRLIFLLLALPGVLQMGRATKENPTEVRYLSRASTIAILVAFYAGGAFPRPHRIVPVLLGGLDLLATPLLVAMPFG